jgi:hypothetical protein
MGPAYFVISILGCADGGVACQAVAAPAAHYASEQACLAAREDTLMANSDLDFPTLFAHCVAVSPKSTKAEPAADVEGAAAA